MLQDIAAVTPPDWDEQLTTIIRYVIRFLYECRFLQCMFVRGLIYLSVRQPGTTSDAENRKLNKFCYVIKNDEFEDSYFILFCSVFIILNTGDDSVYMMYYTFLIKQEYFPNMSLRLWSPLISKAMLNWYINNNYGQIFFFHFACEICDTPLSGVVARVTDIQSWGSSAMVVRT